MSSSSISSALPSHQSAQRTVLGEGAENGFSRGYQPGLSSKHNMTSSEESVPLVTSKIGNQQRGACRNVSNSKKLKIDHRKAIMESNNEGSMDSLIEKLSEQQALLAQQKTALGFQDMESSRADYEDSNTSSGPVTPATTDNLTDTNNPKPCEDGTGSAAGQADLLKLKMELDAAKDKIARQEQELKQSRVIKHALDHANGLQSVPGSVKSDDEPGLPIRLSETFGVNTSMNNSDHVRYIQPNGPTSSVARGSVWNQPNPAGINVLNTTADIWGQGAGRPWISNRSNPGNMTPYAMSHQAQMRGFSGPGSPNSGSSSRPLVDYTRRTSIQHPKGAHSGLQSRDNGWDGCSSPSEAMQMMGFSPNYQPMGMFTATPGTYSPRPIGTPLSPTAPVFNGSSTPGPWNSAPSSPGETYISPMEPLNYRRLLDRSVTCNWKYIVDKIVCSNDQQASIFLQQKLKVGTAEQKYQIVKAIVDQAYPLMVNRFGNFLVQRCFEHGTPEQVIAIANAIRGNTLTLSMDAFGCHVVQKAFDAVPEEYKAIMVHELLRRIPETVIHRYACHVWQKLFELRWSDSPPQIMKYVNEALRGMWHEVALGETGSLVVQNIFENCLEEDKRPCIEAVLKSIDIVAHGQFGNWCIQHICEHGAPADRSRAVDHVLRYATEYSMDQFASKVVEKCLKIGGTEFLERYLERVCEGRPDRPRIPLIDISSDQYGNYLIQYILTQANAQHREIVASHIRKHMVSLRGSKFGSRVGMLCSNPAYATRPGTGAGPTTTRFNNHGPTTRFGGQFR